MTRLSGKVVAVTRSINDRSLAPLLAAEGAEVLQDSDIGKIVAKALNGIDAEVKIEVSVDTSESSPDSP